MKKAIVLKAPGTNNDYEIHNALEASGARAEIVHANELVAGRKRLEDYSILAIPGGFSYGDDLGAGKVFSLFLTYKLREDLLTFIRKGKIVLGVCNGFQVLTKSKVLPAVSASQEATLSFNSCGHFVCKWVKLRVKNDIFWFKGLPDVIELPIAHAEGRFVGSERVSEGLEKTGQIALKYVDNPNGSENDIAGITNGQGNVLGLMPHPERFFYPFQHPGLKFGGIIPWGRIIFGNIVKNA